MRYPTFHAPNARANVHAVTRAAMRIYRWLAKHALWHHDVTVQRGTRISTGDCARRLACPVCLTNSHAMASA